MTINILNFYLNTFKKSNIPKEEYCACKNLRNHGPIRGNRICYSEKCVPTVEKCIKELDLFKAAIIGMVAAENKIKEIERHRKIRKDDKSKFLDKYVRERIKDRKRMWQEIDQGIARLLGDGEKKEAKILNEVNLDKEGMRLVSNNYLTLHGYQFKKWIKSNTYWKFSKKPQFIGLGHYHIMLPMIRFNTLIIFSGHFLSHRKTQNHHG